MARVVKDPEERRIELLQTAQELFFKEGYEQTSVQAITERVGVAKGTFYHYFNSKEDLLHQLAEWRAEEMYPEVERRITEVDGNALDKLRVLFTYIIGWKADNRELTMTLLQIMYRDENLPLRHQILQSAIDRMLPMCAEIMRQGMEEGIFDIEDPESTIEIMLSMVDAIGDRMYPIILSLSGHPENISLLMKKVGAMERAMERILGLEKGTLKVYDVGLIKKLFTGKGD